MIYLIFVYNRLTLELYYKIKQLSTYISSHSQIQISIIFNQNNQMQIRLSVIPGEYSYDIQLCVFQDVNRAKIALEKELLPQQQKNKIRSIIDYAYTKIQQYKKLDYSINEYKHYKTMYQERIGINYFQLFQKISKQSWFQSYSFIENYDLPKPIRQILWKVVQKCESLDQIKQQCLNNIRINQLNNSTSLFRSQNTCIKYEEMVKLLKQLELFKFFEIEPQNHQSALKNIQKYIEQLQNFIIQINSNLGICLKLADSEIRQKIPKQVKKLDQSIREQFQLLKSQIKRITEGHPQNKTINLKQQRIFEDQPEQDNVKYKILRSSIDKLIEQTSLKSFVFNQAQPIRSSNGQFDDALTFWQTNVKKFNFQNDKECKNILQFIKKSIEGMKLSIILKSQALDEDNQLKPGLIKILKLNQRGAISNHNIIQKFKKLVIKSDCYDKLQTPVRGLIGNDEFRDVENPSQFVKAVQKYYNQKFDKLRKQQQSKKRRQPSTNKKKQVSDQENKNLKNRINQLENKLAIKTNQQKMDKINSREINFQGDILYQYNQKKIFLTKVIEDFKQKQIKRTKLLYRYDQWNKTNFHQYLDNKDNIVLIVLTDQNQIVGGFSSESFNSDSNKSKGFIFSITKKKIFDLKKSKDKCIIDDPFYVIFGNSELKIITWDNTLYSNFGQPNGYFDTKDQTFSTLFNYGPQSREAKSREVKMKSFEFYQAEFKNE